MLSLLGVPDDEAVDGTDLTRPFADDRPVHIENLETRVLYGAAHLKGVYAGDLKWVDGGRPRLYDVALHETELHCCASSTITGPCGG